MFPDLHNALFNGGTFVNNVQSNNNTGLLSEGFKILHQHISPRAMHNSGDLFEQPKCHPKTRLAVLRIIMRWIQNLDDDDDPIALQLPFSDMMWLYGSKGVGKTAIARSVSEHCEELGWLLATFFFSRGVEGRNDVKRFVSTIAYQLTQTIPTTLPYIERAVEKDPSIFDKTLKHQVQTLIVHPLKLSNSLLLLPPKKPSTPYLLVIDGLDECEDALAHIQVLKILGSLISQHQLPLKILIVSRPERHIRSSFETGSLCKLATRLALDDSFKPDDDIRLFLSSEFDEMKESHPFRSTIPSTPRWPLKSIVEDLVTKSAGRFAVAAALIRFVASFDHHPDERLKDVLALYDTPGDLLEFLDERPPAAAAVSPPPSPSPPPLLILSDLANSHVSQPFSSLSVRTTSSSPSDKKHSHHSFRRHSISPSLPIPLSNTKKLERPYSEPPLDRARRVKQVAAYLCPIPGCGDIFTRHINFKIHLRTHKKEKKDTVQCIGCKRQFPHVAALDRHLMSEIGVECRKVVESCKMDVIAAPATTSRCCWEVEMGMEMDVEVDKGIGTTEMEID